MKINEALEKLSKIQSKHGPNVEIVFDCPNCNTSFTPDIVVPEPKLVIGIKAKSK